MHNNQWDKHYLYSNSWDWFAIFLKLFAFDFIYMISMHLFKHNGLFKRCLWVPRINATAWTKYQTLTAIFHIEECDWRHYLLRPGWFLHELMRLRCPQPDKFPLKCLVLRIGSRISCRASRTFACRVALNDRTWVFRTMTLACIYATFPLLLYERACNSRGSMSTQRQ